MSVVGQIVDGIKARGLYFVLYEPNELSLRVPPGKSNEVTDAMRGAIKAFREEIIAHEKLTPIPKPEQPKPQEVITQEQADKWADEVDEVARRMGR